MAINMVSVAQVIEEEVNLLMTLLLLLHGLQHLKVVFQTSKKNLL
jgi:hypothetical protein